MDENKEKLKKEILDYLKDHPKAGDTLTGIVEWWLLEREIRHRTQLVQEALAELVADGRVIAKEGRDSQIRYKIKRSRSKRIKAELQKKS